MTFYLIWLCLLISIILLLMFFFFSKKEKYEFMLSSSFECGFTSYFFSRFSFSIHYFLIAFIFLILDLELCILMPLINQYSSNFSFTNLINIFLIALIWGLLKEWEESKLQWYK